MKFLILCLLGHLAWAKTVPKRCCVAEQYETVLGADQVTSTSGEPMRAAKVAYYLSADYKAQKQAMTNMVKEGGQNKWSKIISDFAAKKQYVINDTDCTIYPLQYPMVTRCVPPNAQYLGSSYIGGSTKIMFDNWSFYLSEINANITISVTQEDCTPLFESIGTNTGSFKSELVAAFASFTLGIKDPSVFVPPPGCKSFAPQKAPRESVGHFSHSAQ